MTYNRIVYDRIAFDKSLYVPQPAGSQSSDGYINEEEIRKILRKDTDTRNNRDLDSELDSLFSQPPND